MIDEKRRTKSNYRFLLLSNINIFKIYQKMHLESSNIYIKMKFVTLWRCTIPLQKYFYEVYYYLNISNYYVV